LTSNAPVKEAPYLRGKGFLLFNLALPNDEHIPPHAKERFLNRGISLPVPL